MRRARTFSHSRGLSPDTDLSVAPTRQGAARSGLQASRFLLYSHDGLGLGHVRRSLSVASALAELVPDASVLVATSAEEAESFGLPPGVDILKLPGLRKLGDGRYAARRLRLPLGEIRATRARLLAAAVESFRPAVLLVDRHPFGVGGELEPALEVARALGARAVLGLLDVVDDPFEVRGAWSAGGFFDRIPECYDRLLVYGQRDVFDPRLEYGFPDSVTAMTRFCGYVVAPTRAPSPDNGNGGRLGPAARRPLVLATAGGGEDGFTLLATFVEAAGRARWQAGVVSGPQCGPSHARRLRALAAEAGVAFRRFVPGLSSEFASLDALVCMGGYNTLSEAVASGVPTVSVPRNGPRSDQLIRAQAFAGRGLLRLLEPRRLDAASLFAEVEWALALEALGEGEVRALDLGGARRAARHLLELASGAGPMADPAAAAPIEN